MCGRMTLTRSGREIAEYFELAVGEEHVTEMDGNPLRARYNVAPSQQIMTVHGSEDDARTLRWKQWGLIPSWSQSAKMGGRLFNARSETAAEKPSFRAAWKRRRCLVIADGFYEWTPRNRDHQPYHFRPRDSSLLAFAGLYEEWHGEGGEVIESCTVLTTAASADLEGVHHRMPVILARTDFDRWLDPRSDPAALKTMMHSAPAGTLIRQAVGRIVNNPRVDDPSCLLPPNAESNQEPASDPKIDSTNNSTNNSKRGSSAEPRSADQGELFGPTSSGSGGDAAE